MEAPAWLLMILALTTEVDHWASHTGGTLGALIICRRRLVGAKSQMELDRAGGVASAATAGSPCHGYVVRYLSTRRCSLTFDRTSPHVSRTQKAIIKYYASSKLSLHITLPHVSVSSPSYWTRHLEISDDSIAVRDRQAARAPLTKG